LINLRKILKYFEYQIYQLTRDDIPLRDVISFDYLFRLPEQTRMSGGALDAGSSVAYLLLFYFTTMIFQNNSYQF